MSAVAPRGTRAVTFAPPPGSTGEDDEEEARRRRRQQQQQPPLEEDGTVDRRDADCETEELEGENDKAHDASGVQPSTAATDPGAPHIPTTAPTPRMVCPNCGSHDIEQPHDASGASVCIACGVVVEENAIVSAVEYVPGGTVCV